MSELLTAWITCITSGNTSFGRYADLPLLASRSGDLLTIGSLETTRDTTDTGFYGVHSSAIKRLANLSLAGLYF